LGRCRPNAIATEIDLSIHKAGLDALIAVGHVSTPIDTPGIDQAISKVSQYVGLLQAAASTQPQNAWSAAVGAPPPKPWWKAAGGSVTAGMPYIVGENEPELFVPDVSGTIIPHVPGGASRGGGAGVVNNITVNVAGSVTAANRLVDEIHEGLLKKQRVNGSLRIG
jgi:hypothetical protein